MDKHISISIYITIRMNKYIDTNIYGTGLEAPFPCSQTLEPWSQGWGGEPCVPGTVGRGDHGCKEMLLRNLCHIYTYMNLCLFIYSYPYIFEYMQK